MNATEARTRATETAIEKAAKESAALKKRRAELKKTIPVLRAARIKKIEDEFRSYIKWAVEDGQTSREITLSSDHHDRLRGEYKYLPTHKTRNYRGEESRTWYYATGEGYLRYAPWGKYVKLVLAKLRRDGYKCEVSDVSVRHDDSAAYSNSGGECGSEEIYYTKDTILKISW